MTMLAIVAKRVLLPLGISILLSGCIVVPEHRHGPAYRHGYVEPVPMPPHRHY